MLSQVRATVTAILRADGQSVEFHALAEGETAARRAIAYPALTGPVAVGDTVVLNTTATKLHLGTGGVDFVLFNESRLLPDTFGDPDNSEHIVKLRYTPLQHAVRAVEMDPAYASVWQGASSVGQTPVVVCELHSQIAPVAAGIKAARPDARVAYVMSDEGALPLPFSNLVRDLKAAGFIDTTLTAGQAFGGDYEAVTVPSALLAACWIAHADVVIVSQGPGNAGTGTRYGFGGIMQGVYLDMASRLWGTPIGVLRLSLADKRDRHYGLSHHSVTALGMIAQSPALLAFPVFLGGNAKPATYKTVREAVENSPLGRLHTIEDEDGAPGIALLAEKQLRVTSMGRTPEEDPLFFHAASAAGALAARYIRPRSTPSPTERPLL